MLAKNLNTSDQLFHFVMRFSLAVFYIAAEIKASDKGKPHVRDSKSKGTGTTQSASHPITLPAATRTKHIVTLM